MEANGSKVSALVLGFPLVLDRRGLPVQGGAVAWCGHGTQ